MIENTIYKENISLIPQMIEEIQDYAIILIDLNGNIINWNKGAQRIKGYASKEIIGKNFRNFYTAKDLAANKPDQLLAIASEEGRAEDEGWRVKKDGSMFWGNIVITATHNQSGEHVGFIKLTRDLTERKKAEEALIKHAREIETKNRELEQYTYIASHDLQEPLRTVTNFIRLFETEYEDAFDNEAQQYLSFINEATGRMSKLIKGLLDYSRIGNKKILTQVDLSSLIANILKDLGELLKEANAVVTVEELPTLTVYETEIRLLFQNLISNALKFRNKHKQLTIHISAAQNQKGWQFTVADNGIGIAEKHLDKIFVMFQRLHTRDQYEGTGIGLTHCKKIADLHKGTLKVSSVLGEGSKFSVTINTNELS